MNAMLPRFAPFGDQVQTSQDSEGKASTAGWQSRWAQQCLTDFLTYQKQVSALVPEEVWANLPADNTVSGLLTRALILHLSPTFWLEAGADLCCVFSEQSGKSEQASTTTPTIASIAGSALNLLIKRVDALTGDLLLFQDRLLACPLGCHEIRIAVSLPQWINRVLLPPLPRRSSSWQTQSDVIPLRKFWLQILYEDKETSAPLSLPTLVGTVYRWAQKNGKEEQIAAILRALGIPTRPTPIQEEHTTHLGFWQFWDGAFWRSLLRSQNLADPLLLQHALELTRREQTEQMAIWADSPLAHQPQIHQLLRAAEDQSPALLHHFHSAETGHALQSRIRLAARWQDRLALITEPQWIHAEDQLNHATLPLYRSLTRTEEEALWSNTLADERPSNWRPLYLSWLQKNLSPSLLQTFTNDPAALLRWVGSLGLLKTTPPAFRGWDYSVHPLAESTSQPAPPEYDAEEDCLSLVACLRLALCPADSRPLAWTLPLQTRMLIGLARVCGHPAQTNPWDGRLEILDPKTHFWRPVVGQEWLPATERTWVAPQESGEEHPAEDVPLEGDVARLLRLRQEQEEAALRSLDSIPVEAIEDRPPHTN